MSRYAEDLIENAINAAREMISTGETLRAVQFGHEQGQIWLSSDKNLVVIDNIIMVDGKEFFIGLFKK
jgi:hypothetical protein